MPGLKEDTAGGRRAIVDGREMVRATDLVRSEGLAGVEGETLRIDKLSSPVTKVT